jgi:hypothetical protein
MADAPSGGGSSWSTFEIILGIMILIGLASNIGSRGKFQPVFSETPTKEAVAVDNTAVKKCGLSIVSPVSSQKVSESVRVSGSINGCNWKPDGNTALFAQVIDAQGAPISEFVPVQSTTTESITTNFDTTVSLNKTSSTTGFLILLPAIKTDNSITVRIPLKFIRN